MSRLSASDLANGVRQHLKTRVFARELLSFECVDSTSSVAMQWAREGAPEGSVVMAQEQYAGRGRMGRRWLAEAGKNLLFSVVLRPEPAHSSLGLITVAAGLAVADAIEAIVAAPRASFKWPNDVLLYGRKCCGILLESALLKGAPPVAVIGIGLNVNQVSFPPDLTDTATSLCRVLGSPVARAPLMAQILAYMEERYHELHRNPTAIANAFANRMEGIGRVIRVWSSQPASGVALGITAEGALRLQTEDGERIIHAGDVTLPPPCA